MSVACYLVVHPKGTLMWDVGAVPDSDIKSEGTPNRYRIVLPNGNERFVTATRTLKAQLAAAGYTPADINYLALSHYHYDHTANANLFAKATWLVRQVERDVMFPEKPNDLTQPATYADLRTGKTVIIKMDDYDVFGDGTVVLKLTPGHTPGHQVLFVKLAKTGPVVISGDPTTTLRNGRSTACRRLTPIRSRPRHRAPRWTRSWPRKKRSCGSSTTSPRQRR
jgi:glyoxylase-like metal-dependent hydrolase (beta-lactamase superfamily II)